MSCFRVLVNGAALGLLGAALAPAAEPAVCVLSAPAQPRQIPPEIYGLAVPSMAQATNWHVPLLRWGGNTSERYNWQLGNAWNTGRDWFFENVGVERHAWIGFLDRVEKAGAKAYLNVPLIGYAAKDTSSYAFSVKKYGPQKECEPGRPDVGNGLRGDGTPVTGNSRYDTSIVADPDFVVAWVRAMKEKFPRLFAERRIILAPGNEPMLWHITHRDVHPEPATSRELLERFVKMARAIKAAAPEVQLAGPELWGWPAYFDSAFDTGRRDHADRRARGGADLLPWFLRELRAEEQRGGTRLLDYVSVHFYPQAPNVFSAATDLEATRLRLESVRSLWDADYRDPSWIKERVALLPRLRRWVAENYPGTRIALTEYNWGGENDVSGALALAEILGVLGREGADAACYWTSPPEGSFAAAAYQLFRNADGQGAAFGGEALDATWAGPAAEEVSVFAARDRAAGALTVLCVNKSGLPQALRLRWNGIAAGPARGYALGPSGPRVAALPEPPVAADGVVQLPPRTVMHLRFEMKP
jgi:hypothetical protein